MSREPLLSKYFSLRVDFRGENHAHCLDYREFICLICCLAFPESICSLKSTRSRSHAKFAYLFSPSQALTLPLGQQQKTSRISRRSPTRFVPSQALSTAMGLQGDLLTANKEKLPKKILLRSHLEMKSPRKTKKKDQKECAKSL